MASVHVFYDIALAGVRDLAHAPDPLVGVKMSVLRMLAFAPADADVGAPAPPQKQSEPSKPAQTVPAPVSEKPQTPLSGIAQVRAQLNGADKRTTPRPLADEEPNKGDPAQGAQERESVPEQAPNDTAPTPAATKVEPARSEPAVGNEQPMPPIAPDETANTEPRIEEEAPTPSPRAVSSDDGAPQTPSADVEVAASNGSVESAPNSGADEWHTLVARLELTGFAAQLAHNGLCRRLDESQIVLALARANEFLATPNAKDALQQALATEWAPNDAPRLAIEFVDEAHDTPAQRIEEDAQARQQAAIASIENDPFVKQLRERLGAQLRAETIKPHRSTDAMPNRDEL
jgi:DNA polymerase-3 subunit gamma/tau